MKVYPYRWWLAAFIGFTLSVIAYEYVLSPQVDALVNLQAQEKRLARELIILKKIEVKQIDLTPKMSKMEWLTTLPMLTQLNGVVMRAITMKPTREQSTNELKIRFIVEGDFAPITRFIVAMHEQTPNGLIENFSYQVTKQHTLLLTIDLLLMTNHLTQSLHKIAKPTTFHSPFCLATNTAAAVRMHDAAVSGLSITQMKMAGYMEQGERQMALIMLPTGALAEVYVGDEVGLEKSVVTKIVSNQLKLTLVSGEVKILRMDRIGVKQ